METSVSGYPRIGLNRELKFAIESYLKGEINLAQLEVTAREIRVDGWNTQKSVGITYIPSNDFSFYDNMLDTAMLFGIVPREYLSAMLSPMDTMFAMARGHQSDKGLDLKALPMRKWFNTNYHYIVPTFDESVKIKLSGTKPLDEFKESLALGIRTRPVIIGPLTLLKLSAFPNSKRAPDFADDLCDAYADLLRALESVGASCVQFDEPSLVTDLDDSDIWLFNRLYGSILLKRGEIKTHLNVSFGDVRDCYKDIVKCDFDSVGLDFIEGYRNLELIGMHGFPAGKKLVAGIVNGKSVWRCDYEKLTVLVHKIKVALGGPKPEDRLGIGTSCSLIHVPIGLEGECKLDATTRARLAFAREKLAELTTLAVILDSDGTSAKNAMPPQIQTPVDTGVSEKIASLSERDFMRLPSRAERRVAQQRSLNLLPLPTTTIGSFPQTNEARELRARLRKGAISVDEYNELIKGMIKNCIELQEDIGLDVLVHGEFERNDMVEFFGQNLEGFAFTQNGWVQSYGTRCVKPPIIVSDIARSRPITVELAVYAQSLSRKPVKGMLTGPVTILNWSFPREDIPLRTCAFQLALAVRDEVLDLESKGIGIIQIDEAAFREKAPLRYADRDAEYFSWAIPAFRLTHSGVRAETQIHTHMCYSDFTEIVPEIDAMDADVITFEASRSKLEILDYLVSAEFQTAVGPGVYDIHSPRVPSSGEIEKAIETMLSKLGKAAHEYDGVWVNPDCGLKTRDLPEVEKSLRNLVTATKRIRDAHSGRD